MHSHHNTDSSISTINVNLIHGDYHTESYGKTQLEEENLWGYFITLKGIQKFHLN